VEDNALNLGGTGPLVNAWAVARRGWAGVGPRTVERNLRVINRYYGVDSGVFNRPPTRLVLDWYEEGAPSPGAWIETKLQAIARALDSANAHS